MNSPKFKKGDRVIIINVKVENTVYNIFQVGWEGSVTNENFSRGSTTLVKWDKFPNHDLTIYTKDIETIEVFNSPLYQALL